MNRAGDDGSAEALVAAFFRAAKPYQTPAGRRERLRVALTRENRARPVRASLKLGLALGLVVCGAATVSAHLLAWPRWLAERLPGREVSTTHNPAAAPVPPAPAEAPRAEALPPIAQGASAAEEVSAPPPAPARSVTRAPMPRHRHTAPAPTPPPAPAKAALDSSTAEEDAALALAALSALRRDHDPARARAMVDVYLRAHPDGSMAEEALAISIEAAAAHHDADAKALAARYLARYPSGSYQALARATLRSEAAPR